MKRLIATLVLSFGIILGSASTLFAAPRYWELQMFDPSQTTEKTINIEFKVFSTVASDDFTVQLKENGANKASKAITTQHGDSDVFNVSIPATGTYIYQITATNIGDGTQQSESRTVEVVNGPEPTVRTVFVNNEPDAPATTANAGNAENNDGQVAAADDEAAGQDTNGEDGEGQVTDEAANSQQDGSSEEDGGVLGATDQANNNGRTNVLVALLLLGGAAGSYYWFVQRPRSSL
jgi:hypothetical protein